ncbi:leucine-rich repeat-containing 31 isoform X1 [Pelobates cultripes]|uniref:Leucine-rich repeat-containing 31 isoform X1 n=2 Tax=Pelobates cultripes TaxID=61616 RepID=A0AAD1VRB4_PELCU|nr:leucine-rich repeat-containing 31 isoform X1 [Pelobates cultripes]
MSREDRGKQESEKVKEGEQKRSAFDLFFNPLQRKKNDNPEKTKNNIFQVNRFFRGFDRKSSKTDKENEPPEESAPSVDPTPDNVNVNPDAETEPDPKLSDWWKVEQFMQKFGKKAESTSININNCDLTQTDMKELSLLVSFLPDAEEIDLSWNDLIGGSIHLLTSQFQHVCNLKILSLSNCSLTEKDFTALGESFNLIPHLESLDLSWNSNLGCSLFRISQHVPGQSSIRTLNLTECNLKLADGDSLAQAVSKMPKLEVLDLSANSEFGVYVYKFIDDLKRCSYLRELKLHGTGLQQDSIQCLSSAFQYWPYLRKLDLSCNKKAGGGFQEATAGLTSFKHLDLLDIHQCCLSRDDVAALTQVIPLLSDLKVLNISSNKMIGQSPEHLFSRLRFLPKLRSVIASNCALTKESFAALAEASRYLLDLEILDLSWNKCVGGNLQLMSGSLKYTTALHSLILSSCNLVTHDLAVLASTLQDGHLQRLLQLDLAYNDTIPDEGWGLLFESIGALKNITELDISLRPASRRNCGPWFIHFLSSLLKLPKLKEVGMQRWVLSPAEQQQLDRVCKDNLIHVIFD